MLISVDQTRDDAKQETHVTLTFSAGMTMIYVIPDAGDNASVQVMYGNGTKMYGNSDRAALKAALQQVVGLL